VDIALTSNIRLGSKLSTETKNPAYFVRALMMRKASFITLTRGAKVRKLILFVIYEF
jgi:hypothetical protein